ncbi:octanoyl-[GcvH]:protein N-octanoyltransferase [Paraliobacillus quinghaiensis]|uniref:Octanoyl-[GcvH]:protein N-octanoyltransferase n=1 Tax=Paraliobacillus quinghaiensis TaxID=470815 RepID=A0A917TQ40_9BACI|nr:lipoate--protein ligase family protein [Paraliobacillus quinghaiensis]GGM32909.1 octanoyl-[GcvH]:protein N-octanoyltransferase [Paraliobacillus quinghaiensis]
MTDWKNFFSGKAYRLIDHSDPLSLDNAMDSFAIDDAIALSVSKDKSAHTIRLWVHNKTIVLGISDARLPYIEEAVSSLQAQGYQTIVRNSGGLAVVLDKGVLNISLLLSGGNSLGIHQGYEVMVAFIQDLLADYTTEVKAFEVEGSYCPGDYDLSIDGKKFAGISQRRVRDGIAVQIYLSIEGDGQAHARLIRDFYQVGLRGEETKIKYPTVRPETMRSLSELVDKPITVELVKDRLTHMLDDLTVERVQAELSDEEVLEYQKRKKQMIERNKKALGDLA